jgi:dynamin 1-like protein
MDQSLISTQLRSVIKLTEILKDIKLGYYIKLPKIVAVGFRGSGKSSLIEQIIGLDFLPCGPVIYIFYYVGRCN